MAGKILRVRDYDLPDSIATVQVCYPITDYAVAHASKLPFPNFEQHTSDGQEDAPND
jgi:hypothetical protein